MFNVEAMEFPGQFKQTEEKTVEPVKNVNESENSANTYPFNETHNAEWNRVMKDLPVDNSLARSWARMLDRGILIGSPTSAIYDNTFQDFQYARGSVSKDGSVVVFFDARGVVGTESGL